MLCIELYVMYEPTVKNKLRTRIPFKQLIIKMTTKVTSIPTVVKMIFRKKL